MTPDRESSDGAIQKHLAGLLDGASALLSERVQRTVVFGPGQGWVVNRSVLVKEIRPPLVVLHSMHDEFWLEFRDAATLAGFWRRAGDEVIGVSRASGTLAEEDRGALREIGDLLHQLLRKSRVAAAAGVATEAGAVARVDQMRRENDVAQRAATRAGDDLFLFSFACTLDSFPPSRMHLLLTPDTANSLNGGPVLVAGDGDAADELQPPAAVRGTLAVYARDRIMLTRLRKVCRRMGFRHEPHALREVPNPSVHRDGFVLIQIGEGEEKRFDWCKRLKTLGGGVKVCLVLDYPSRSNVLQACRSGADSVMGAPVSEVELSELLGEWLPEEDPAAKAAPAAPGNAPAAGAPPESAAAPRATAGTGAAVGAETQGVQAPVKETEGPATERREPSARP